MYKSVWDRIQGSYKSARLLNLNPLNPKKMVKNGYYGNEDLGLVWGCVDVF